MLRTCLCLLAGAIAPQLSSFPTSFDQLFLLLVALGAALILLLPNVRRRDVLLFLTGVILFWGSAQSIIDGRLDRDFEGDSILTELRITDFPRVRGQSAAILATPVDDVRVPERIRLSWQEPPVTPQIGDIWQLEIRLRRPRGNLNPGSMDFEAWLFRERIGASGYVVSGRRSILLDSNTSRGIERIRLNFHKKIINILGDSGSVGVVLAIAIGARQQISTADWERYARTGTSHLMAISGLHVGLAAVAAYLLAIGLLGLFGRGNHHFVALIVALLVAGMYVAVSGFAVPARRAILMLAVATLIVLWRREVSAARVLAAAIIAIVCSDPVATMEPGFKLSFAAVAILFWFAKQRQAFPAQRWQRPVYAIRGLVLVQLMLLISLMPLTIILFDRVSLAAPLVNLVAVPLFSVVTVPCVLLGLALPNALHPLAEFCLRAAAVSIDWLEQLITLAARLPYASVPIASLENFAWLLLCVPLVWALLPPGWPARRTAWLGAIALLSWRPHVPPEGCVDIRALDVGQGLALVLQTRSRVLVYDTGPSWRGGRSAGERILVPYLRNRGLTRIDKLIVSHADLDHAGGVLALLAEVQVDELLAGEDLPWISRPISQCSEGMNWSWNAVNFSILQPPRGANLQGNAASCVLLIEAGQHRALLSGDIEAQTEAALVRQRILPEVDLVTVPHHGSRTSSIGPFVRALTPSVALVSAGYGNRWGFPKADVVARWRASGATVLNTADSGSIRVRMCVQGGLSEPFEWRIERRRLWHEDDS